MSWLSDPTSLSSLRWRKGILEGGRNRLPVLQYSLLDSGALHSGQNAGRLYPSIFAWCEARNQRLGGYVSAGCCHVILRGWLSGNGNDSCVGLG